MIEQKHEVLADMAWYEHTVAEGRKLIGIFYHQNDRFVGGSIIVEFDHMISLAFKANERISVSSEAGSNLGVILEYDFLCYAQSKGKIISSGRSKNAFGVSNTLGYLASKLRLGYYPVMAENTSLLQTIPLSQNNDAFFFGREESDSSNASHELLPVYLTSNPENLDPIKEIKDKIESVRVITL
jgi:hypothetical protein